MESSDDFNLNIQIKNWTFKNLKENEVTPSDRQEFMNHFYDSIQELVDMGLSEEEAFFVVERRFGERRDWASELKSANEDNIQLKQITTVFTSVVIYLVLYNLMVCMGRSLLIISNYLGVDIRNSLDYTKRFFFFMYALNIAAIVALYFIHKPIKWILKNISMKIRSIVILLFFLILSLILENYLVPVLANEIEHVAYRSLYFQQELGFKYVYSFLIGTGYLIIYLKSYKKNNIV
ncbi:MAG TPA: hypothetical protein VEP89_02070 [Draconibacterium sp.]|nr:hypothetical protein [Draconibacterium sp.]